MGSESFKSDSNSNSNSNSSSNSANEDIILEEMNCPLGEIENIYIKRVWAVKRSISLSDRHVNVFFYKKKKINLTKGKKNIFEIQNECKWSFKHWAVILELSNGSFVNIQFGRNGFSLNEFNETENKGENILNSILDTWGKDGHPFSFCELGDANYKYDKLIANLKAKKIEEKKIFEENGKIYYNMVLRNCQNFVCDIEKILFGEHKKWHSFNYYLEQFYNHFFPEVDFDNLKSIYKEKLTKENEDVYYSNMDNIIELCRTQTYSSEDSFYKLQNKLTDKTIELSYLSIN